MNQKKKIIIIIGATSFLCGSPIIFLALRDNQQQKNNLIIKKKRKQKKEHSVLFWIVLTIEIFIILAIITKYIYNLYQYLKTPEKTPRPLSEEQKQLFRKKKSKLQCSIIFLIKKGIAITLQTDQAKIKKDEEEMIKNILKEDLDEQTLPNDLSPDFYQQAKNVDLFKINLQKLIDFLKKYLTVQILEDVYNDPNEYGLLTTMAVNMMANIKNDVLILHTGHLKISANEEQPAETEDIEKINKKQYHDLLDAVLRRTKVTFIKDETNNKKHYLFPNLFKFYKFVVRKFHHCLMTFFLRHKDKYEKLLTQFNQDLNKLDRAILKID